MSLMRINAERSKQSLENMTNSLVKKRKHIGEGRFRILWGGGGGGQGGAKFPAGT